MKYSVWQGCSLSPPSTWMVPCPVPVTPRVQCPTPPVRCMGDRVCVGQVWQDAPVTVVSQATTISTLVAVNVSEHCVLLNNIYRYIRPRVYVIPGRGGIWGDELPNWIVKIKKIKKNNESKIYLNLKDNKPHTEPGW